MNFAFLIDPLATLRPGHDSTLAMMQEACARGHRVLAFEQKDLRVEQSVPIAHAREISFQGENALSEGSALEVPLSSLEVVFLRKDPPVDVEFYNATLLVEHGSPKEAPFFINHPNGLRAANEKLLALEFPEFCPPTLVDRDVNRLRDFIREHQTAVIKPLDGHGGHGVLIARDDDPNASSLIEVLTRSGADWVVAQTYLPEAKAGDKRILLLDGEPLGAVLRVPSGADFRGNMARGAQPMAADISDREKALCEALKPRLRALGLWFVGIDVIGGYLTEVNVTSPTGIVEINALGGAKVEKSIIDFAEQASQARK